MTDEVVLDWFCLINSKGMGPKTFWSMMRNYKTAKESLKHIANPFPKKEAEKILKKVDGGVILANEADFPKLLRRSDLCPPMLFYKGDRTILQKRKIGIIGARNCSISGQSMARRLASGLAEHCAIVSGMARGIDASAHLGSLKQPENKAAIAVLPFGLDRVYPKENAEIYDAIARDGLLLTSVFPGAVPDHGMFHARNRIIVLLVDGLIVIEAAAKSGSLAVARLALDLGCEVMAVPGSPIDQRSFGSNCLIKNGATLVQDHHDVIDVLKIEDVPGNSFETKEVAETPKDELKGAKARVLAALSGEPALLDEISAHANVNMSQLLSIISELEIAGKVVRNSANEISLM